MALYEGGMVTLRKLINAVGLNPDDGYTRVVIECGVSGVGRVYATKHLNTDDVLRVVETLDGAKVEAKNDDTVEIVTLTESQK